MRLFYASFLSSENIDAYESLVTAVSSDVPGVLRPIPARTHHVTLAFLGDIAETDVPACREVLRLAGRVPAAPLTLDSSRILYSRKTPRLVCVGLREGAEPVARVQKLVCREIGGRIPSLDLRPKPPHVTVARFRKNVDRGTARRVEEALRRHEGPDPARTDRLTSVHLVRSTLTPSGPIYETVEESMLLDSTRLP